MAAVPDPVCVLLGSPTSPVTSVCQYILPTGKSCLISSDQKGFVSLWDLQRRRVTSRVQGHKESILATLVAAPSLVLTHGRDRVIKTWSVEQGSFENTGLFQCFSSGFCPAKTLRLGNQTVVAMPNDDDSVVDIVNLHNKEIVLRLAPSEKRGMVMHICAVEVAEDSCEKLLVGYEDGYVTLWEMTSQTALSSTRVHLDTIMSLDFSCKQNKGIAVSTSKTITAFELDEQDQINPMKSTEATNAGFNSVKIRQDAKLFTTCGWDGKVRYFSLKKLSPLAVLDYHKESALCQTFFDNNHLAVGSKDGNISVWNLYA